MKIGIDLGGTKTEIVALDENKQEIYRKRVATPKGDYEKTVMMIKDIVFCAFEELKQKGSVGICIPGTISPATGLVKNANATHLIGKPFDKDLKQALGQEIKIANDADCFALSEAVDGAGMGAKTVWGVIIGTGAGSGIIAYNKLISGPNAIGGEWGHNPLPFMDEEEKNTNISCYCGKCNCIETFVSGTGFVRDYKLLSNKDLSGKEIVSLANNGDEIATKTLKRYETRLAKSLASVINILDPEVVVLGGGMSNVDSLYENVPKIWGDYVFSDTVFTKLKKAKFGDSSGVRGAAFLWE
ncbi:MAG: Fructokinase [Alphaproteobacteria bacterium ADurb.Bin438]|nr:MAG: Fructokinase [Alphaproteobacteria bacterium ADurb.Bin438]